MAVRSLNVNHAQTLCVLCTVSMGLKKMSMAVTFVHAMNAAKNNAECYVNMASRKMSMGVKNVNVNHVPHSCA